jgi:hypothetical protein
MEPNLIETIVGSRTFVRELNNGTRNFAVAARGADPRHHHYSSDLPSLKKKPTRLGANGNGVMQQS